MQPFRPSSALRVQPPSSQLRQSFILRQEHLVQFVRRQFGLTPFQSKLLVYGNRCDNLNEIYQCLVKDGPQQTYLHLFCPDANRLCHICQDVEASHSYVSQTEYVDTVERIKEEQNNENSSLLAVGPMPTELSEEAQGTHECNICLGVFPLSQIVHFDGENHHCCISCVGTFLTEEINCGRVDLTCPHCSRPLKNGDVESLVDSKTFKKYKLFLGNKLIMKNNMLRWCPNPKCSKVVEVKSKFDRTVECVCGTVLCTKCNRQYHPSQTCQSVFKKQIQSWSDATDIQKCKKCKSIIQKVSGCNHMTCGFCKYEWCWLCGSTYSPIHFSPLNPFGCPGLQRGDHMAQNWGCLKLWLYRLACFLIILILLPIALPIGLLVAGPALIISTIRDNSWYYYRGCCCKFFIWIIFIIIGLVVNPFAWVGLLIYAIAQGVVFAKRYFEQQRQIEENSTRHLRERLIEQKLNE